MNKLEQHLSIPETTLFGKIKNVLLGATVIILWTKFILWIYKATIPEFGFLNTSLFTYHSRYSIEFNFILLCILAPLIEEYLFRKHLSIVKNIKMEGILFFFIIFSSIIFAIGHPLKIWAAPIQGIGGLLLCYVYIKNGYSYISSVIVHFLINLYFFLN